MENRTSYSVDVLPLLRTLPVTFGAKNSLRTLNSIKRANRKQLNGEIDTLVALTGIQKGHVIIQVNGHVSLESDENRQPGGRKGVFRYENLVEGFLKPVIGIHTMQIRRSCEPNSTLKHIMCFDNSLNFFLSATRDIPYGHEITLPFESDWIYSLIPLECAEHYLQLADCPFEIQRIKHAESRDHQIKIEDDEKETMKLEEKVKGEEDHDMENLTDVIKVSAEQISQENTENQSLVDSRKTNGEQTIKQVPVLKKEQLSEDHNDADFEMAILIPEKYHCESQGEEGKPVPALEEQSESITNSTNDPIEVLSSESSLVEAEDDNEASTETPFIDFALHQAPYEYPNDTDDDTSQELLVTHVEESDCSNLIHQEVQIMDFLAERSRNIQSPLALMDLYMEVADKTDSTLSKLSYCMWNKIISEIHKTDRYDIETKVRILFATSSPIDVYFLEELRKQNTSIEIDNMGRITFYKSNESGLELSGIHSCQVTESLKIEELLPDGTTSQEKHKKRKHSIQSIIGLEEDDEEEEDKSSEIVQIGTDDDDIICDFQKRFIRKKIATSSSEHQEKRGLRSFLRLLKYVVTSLENPQFNDLSQRIQEIIETVGYSHEQIPIDNIQSILETAFSMVIKTLQSSSSEFSTESTMSLGDFLSLLKVMILGLESDKLDGLLEEVNANTQRLEVNDEKISNSKVRLAIEWILTTISQ